MAGTGLPDGAAGPVSIRSAARSGMPRENPTWVRDYFSGCLENGGASIFYRLFPPDILSGEPCWPPDRMSAANSFRMNALRSSQQTIRKVASARSRRGGSGRSGRGPSGLVPCYQGDQPLRRRNRANRPRPPRRAALGSGIAISTTSLPPVKLVVPLSPK
jgi:hypothetical protein